LRGSLNYYKATKSIQNFQYSLSLKPSGLAGIPGTIEGMLNVNGAGELATIETGELLAKDLS